MMKFAIIYYHEFVIISIANSDLTSIEKVCRNKSPYYNTSYDEICNNILSRIRDYFNRQFRFNLYEI